MRSMLVTAVLVVLAMLGVALYARSHGVGPMRAVTFAGPQLTLTTNLKRPVAVLIDVVGPNGSVTPIAWANLGLMNANALVPAFTIPPDATLQLRWSFDQEIICMSPGGTTSVAPIGTVQGGDASRFGNGAMMFRPTGGAITGAGTQPLKLAPGRIYQIDFGAHGPNYSSPGPVPLAPATPPAPTSQSAPGAQQDTPAAEPAKSP